MSRAQLPKQRFLLSAQVLESVSTEEVDATYKDMAELGIAKPPYPQFEVWLPAKKVLRLVDTTTGEESTDVRWHNDDEQLVLLYADGEYSDAYLCLPTGAATYRSPMWSAVEAEEALVLSPKNMEAFRKTQEGTRASAADVYRLLLVLLATKNIVKTTVENKRLKFGIGKNKLNAYRYTTTLTIGAVEEEHREGPPTGRTVRPHLRRGHKRRQHYGPNYEFVRLIFIQPVFVNADQEFISARTAYNVRMEQRPCPSK